MADQILFSNNGATALSVGIDSVTTTVSVSDGTVFDTPGANQYTLVTVVSDTGVEIMKCTAVAGNTLTVVRAQEGTSNLTHSNGSVISNRVTADTMDQYPQGFDNDGDAKGAGAVNLQGSRSASTQVASGADAITVGNNTTASAVEAVAVGKNSLADAAYAVAIGGADAGGQAAVAAGFSADASGLAAISLGDSSNASGDGSRAVGQTATTNQDRSIADGYAAQVIDTEAGITTWSAAETVVIGDLRTASVSHRILECVTAGITGGSQPSLPTIVGGLVTDNTAEWVYIGASISTGGIARGNSALAIGGDTIADGSNTTAAGDGCVAIQADSEARGLNSTAISGKITGTSCGVFNGQFSSAVPSRAPIRATIIGNGGVAVISETTKLYGPDYVSLESWLYEGGNAPQEHMPVSAKEQVFCSPPLTTGVSSWAATTSYVHNECVTPTTPNGYSYYAYCYPAFGDYYEDQISGGTEPAIWPTTPGDSVEDGGVWWICVDPANIRVTIPDNLRFIPREVGFLCDAHADVTPGTQPTISWGVQANKAKWKAATITTMLVGPYAGQHFDVTNSEGAKDLTAAVTILGSGQTSGVVYWKGICVETMDA